VSYQPKLKRIVSVLPAPVYRTLSV